MVFSMGVETILMFFGTIPGAIAGLAALGLANRMIARNTGGKMKSA